jgi:hypothetical protein
MVFPFAPQKTGNFCFNCECWTMTINFTGGSGPFRSCSPEVKETHSIELPNWIRLPVLADIEWSTDDDAAINGERLGGTGVNNGCPFGPGCCAQGGSKQMTLTERSLQIDLIDTVGVGWGGYVKITIC